MDQIKTALCSFGMSGRVFHAPFIYVNPGFILHGVLERSNNQAKEKYPGIKVYRNIDQLTDDKEVQLVIVNVPNSFHYTYAKKAITAGKHVIVEKPFTVTTAEADDLICLAEYHNVKISVYHNRRWDSDFLTVRKILRDSLLNTITEAEIHFDRFKESLSPKLHKEIPGPGAGILYDLGSHIIDQALVLFGMPEQIFADVQSMRKISKVDDYFEILLYYKKLRVRLKAGYVVKESAGAYIIHGTGGSFIKHRTDVQEEDLINGKIPGTEGWGIEREINTAIMNTVLNGKTSFDSGQVITGNYMHYFDMMYQALITDSSLPVTASEGRNVIKIIETAYLSSNEQRVITL